MNRHLALVTALALAGLPLAGCLGGPESAGGTLQQAGSSTVFPIAETWAEELLAQGVLVTVSGGGTGAGASRLCAKEIDIADLSRHLKDSEIETCRANGVDPVTWLVAYDGLTVVVDKDNAFVDHLTIDELNHIWRSEGPARTWADVRPGWPDEKILLYGPDSDSGTYEYFNEEILGKDCGVDKKEACPPRSDFVPSPDDNVLVEGVAGSKFAIGHFGFSYYVENRDRLRAVPIVPPGGEAPVAPTFETIANGTYKPLSRPLFMATDGIPADGTTLHTYFEYALGEGQPLVREIGYVELDARTIASQRAKLGL